MGSTTRGIAALAVLFCARALLGCGDSDATGDGMLSAGATAPMATSFARDVQPVIDGTCNCHQTEPILMAPFSLKPADSYSNLVQAASMQASGMVLVSPGSLNDSYLWHKLNGTQAEVNGSGARMPSTFPLDPPDLDLFGRWIAEGAAP